ncbi:isopeptide-forming domain-containing fimbrial protein, partial [Gemella taiwanensis]
NLSGYVTKEGQTQVPNKAQYRVDLPNKPGVTKDSNVVPVTPPPSDPTKPNIVKTVNNKQQQVLSKIDEEFVYRISTTMPENAEQFNVLDKLESVLEFSGKPEVSVNGKKVNTKITQNDGELNVEFKGDFVKQNAGKSIEIEFKAKITKDADLSKYRDSGYAVPNEARYIVNNDPKITGKTPPVFVTPPPIKIVPPKPGEKSINSENGEENETLRELKVNNEVFRYDIKERLGINQDYKQFAISDDLEKVLDILKAEVRIDGEKVDTIAVNKELAKLNDELTKVQNKLQQAKGESTARKDARDSEIKLTDKKQQLEVVNSKIKSEKIREKVVELNKEKVLLEKDIETLTSELAEKQKTIGNNSINKEELEKVVHDLNKQIKDYKESDKFKAIELLNNALSTRNDKNTIDKEALKKIGDLVVKDNTVVFEVTNKDILKLLEGREVTLSIYAKIKDNVDLSKYKDENVIKVPNEAKIIFDHKPKVTNKVYVLPKPKDPTPPPGEVPPIPEIPKEPKPKKPTPPTPEIPTQPKPKKPTPQVPTTKVEKALAKTGVTTSTSTGWLGVIGLIALLFVRKYSNNRKDK